MAKILVVDDDPGVRRLIVKWLEADGYDVVEARTGSEAILLAQQSQIDGVVMDVMLPDMNGFAASNRIRAVPGYRTLPIIGLTGLDVRMDVAHEGGCTDLLLKPVERQTLVDMLQRHLKGPKPKRTRSFNKERHRL